MPVFPRCKASTYCDQTRIFLIVYGKTVCVARNKICFMWFPESRQHRFCWMKLDFATALSKKIVGDCEVQALKLRQLNFKSCPTI
jgi:hypothetical protein